MGESNPGRSVTAGTPRQRRKRSSAVALGVVGALALTLTSCDESDGGAAPDERCVDTTTYKIVADRLCNNAPGGGYADSDRYQWYLPDDGSTGPLAGWSRSYGDPGGYGSGYGSGSGGYHGRSRSGSLGSGSNDGTGHSVSRGGLGGHGSGSHGG